MAGPPPRWLDRRFQSRPEAADLAGELARWQALRLAALLRWAAAHSPWYGRHWPPGAAARAAADLETLAGGRAEVTAAHLGARLADLPPTSPADLAGQTESFLAVRQDEVEGVVSVPTSGTSGQSRRIQSTAADLEETVVFFEYGMRFLVAPGSDRVALAMSPARPGNVADLLGRALARWRIPFLAHGFVPGGAAEAAWLAELAGWRPTCLVGVPTQMAAIARHPLADRLALKTLLLSGEVAEDRLVRELEQNFPGCRVFRHYGLTEAGLGGAVECDRRQGPHLRDDLWAEIIGPDGQPRPPGVAGEITLTPLTRLGMPLIRYRTGDEGLILAKPCPCGSQMARLQIFGRLADRFTLPSGRSLRPGDFEAPLAGLPFIRGYDLKLHEGRQALTLALLTTAGAPAAAPRLAAEAIGAWLGPAAAGLTLAVTLNHQLEASGKRRLERTAEPPAADFIAAWPG